MEKIKITKKTILVTGGAGYLGSVLVGELLRKGYKVRVIDCLMFGGESLLAFFQDQNFTFIKGDIRNVDFSRRQLEDVYAVCHLAALVGEPACEVDPEKTREINLDATKWLVKNSQEFGIERFIFASTCSNYGVVKVGSMADETYPLQPLSLYAETKIAAEEEVLGLANNTFHPTVLRFATLFGLSPRMRFNLLINEMIRSACFGKKISIYKPYAWRPFLHINDAASCVIKTLSAPKKLILGEIFNVVGENKKKIDLVSLVQKYFPGVSVSIIEKSVVDPRDYKVSGEKIRQKLKFSAKYSVEEGMIQIKEAIQTGVFENPYDRKYNVWVNENLL